MSAELVVVAQCSACGQRLGHPSRAVIWIQCRCGATWKPPRQVAQPAKGYVHASPVKREEQR